MMLLVDPSPLSPHAQRERRRRLREEMRFRLNRDFATEFADGTVQSGLHGVRLMATARSGHVGPRCQSCCCVNDLRRCGGCRQVWYCGDDCQRADWASHRAECKAKKGTTRPPGEDPRTNTYWIRRATRIDGESDESASTAAAAGAASRTSTSR